ncbi:MAG: hypothetical protein Q8M83_01705 [bacterium]|nr:hypothetical protein [bacterium]
MEQRRPLFDNWPFMRGWEELIGGDRFTYIEVGPSVSIIPIRRGANGKIEIVLIRERRIETSQPIVKSAGGFLRERSLEDGARQIIFAETGIHCGQLYLLVPKMEGFTVIDLPIATFIGLDWTMEKEGSAERIIIPLSEAVDLVLKQEIPDQCNADAIMRLALLEQLGRLPI